MEEGGKHRQAQSKQNVELGPLYMVHDSTSLAVVLPPLATPIGSLKMEIGTDLLWKNVSVKHDHSRVGKVIVEFTLK